MKKKCINGLVCIENTTLFFLGIVIVSILYLFYSFNNNQNSKIDNSVSVSFPYSHSPPPAVIGPLQTVSSRSSDPFNDPYSPPLKTNDLFYPMFFGGGYSSGIRTNLNGGGDIRQTPNIPISVSTTNYPSQYSQMGILTRKEGKDDLILPLMGRRINNGRDKWQYYTISNNGNLNTKLPIIFNGRNCTSENGCNEMYSNDTVYVEGYKDKFVTTVYENQTISYIPVI